MRITVMQPVEIDVDAIRLEVPVVHEEEVEDLGSDFPGLDPATKRLTLTLDLATGTIRGWPAGREASAHLMPRDEGSYFLLDGERVVASIEQNYVPRCLPGEFGDYVTFRVTGDGRVLTYGERREWKPRPSEVAEAFFGEGA
ncbi:MAG TPA: hypothetical protein VEB22_15285 [Phycisphaerales bacterium]|nr:hypothetical protein [Phycisphaerales bacterium]